MDLQNIEKRVIFNISELVATDCSKIERSMSLVDDLDANSIEIAELFLNLESEFNISLEKEFELGAAVTVDDIITLVEKNMA